MTKSRILLALGLSLALAVPTAASAAMMDMPMMHMDAPMMKMMETAKASPMSGKMMAAMDAMSTADRDFWLKCTFHHTAACDAAMASMMAAK